jgi:nitrate/nitrite-specific signal transduction histidine kinase
VELVYGQDLVLRVIDNGQGIDQAIVEQGRKGHYGLQGMKERAARIHGRLALVSSPKRGTEITLIVPGRNVFRGSRPLLDRVLRWAQSFLFRGRDQAYMK